MLTFQSNSDDGFGVSIHDLILNTRFHLKYALSSLKPIFGTLWNI